LEEEPNANHYYDTEVKLPPVIEQLINPKKEEEEPLQVVKSIMEDKSSRLGTLRLRITELVVWFLELGYQKLDTALKETGIIGICLDLFFLFPNCSVFHALVTHMVKNIMEGSSNTLKSHILVDCNLIGNMLNHQKDHDSAFVGHFLLLANAIEACSKKVPYVSKWLSSKKEWGLFISGKVKDLKQSQVQPFLPPTRPTGGTGLDWSHFGSGPLPQAVINIDNNIS